MSEIYRKSYICFNKTKNIGGNFMSNGMRNLKELVERYLKTLSNEELCDDSEDLIEFIETIRDDELICRMGKAGDELVDTPPTNDGYDEQIIE